MPHQRTPESLERIERIRSLSDGQRTSVEIAALVGCTPKFVQSIVLEFDLPRLPRGGRQGVLNSSWKGGRQIDLDGYVHTSLGLEHRVVAEQTLGRALSACEVVDHIDGLTLHNHPDNLRVFASNADHLRATISGQIPRWSSEGRQKLNSCRHRRAKTQAVDTWRRERERGDVRLRQILRAWLQLGEGSPYLSGTLPWLDKAGIYDLSRTSLELRLEALSQRD